MGLYGLLQGYLYLKRIIYETLIGSYLIFVHNVSHTGPKRTKFKIRLPSICVSLQDNFYEIHSVVSETKQTDGHDFCVRLSEQHSVKNGDIFAKLMN
jgi:hypothetical protein